MKIFLPFIFIFLPLLFNAQPNCGAASTGFTPINDLGTGISPVTGLMGGLYPNGSNFLPSAHKAAGLQQASQVQCLNANGVPDPVNGKIVWLSIGMSNCTQETQQFIPQANSFPGKNPALVLVDGAQGGQTAQVISAPWNSGYTNFWNTVNSRLTNAGVSPAQVQVIWLKEANQAGSTPVQTYYDSLVVQFKRIANELKTRFPNVKLCYLASRISARYATTSLNPEPYAYWTGWAVKKVIEEQINGNAQLSYSGPGAKSPWLSWGIYMWSDGSTAQASNPAVFYNCPGDFQNDGTHPSTAGAQKVGGLLLNFFSTDSTTTPWFLGTGCLTGTGINSKDNHSLHLLFQNPDNRTFSIRLPEPIAGNIDLEIYDVAGRKIYSKQQTNLTVFYFSNLKTGIYFLRIKMNEKVYQERFSILK